jgi:amino acid permease-like protein
VSRALARDKLGVLAVLAFILASIAPMTVAAGVIPTAYAITGLAGIPVAFLVVAVVLALFCPGYVAMSRRIRNAGAFYAFASAGLGKVTGVAAALMALVAYESFQCATYGALGPSLQAEAAAHLGVNWPWWAWALIIWAVVTVLGLARVEVAGRVLAVLTAAEIVIVVAETISGLTSPAGGHLDLGALSPSALTASGAGALGVLAVIAGLAFVGFEQSPVLGEETRNARRTIPAATYTALAAIGTLYAAAAWAMQAHAGRAHVAAAAAAQGPGLLYGLSSSGALAQGLAQADLFQAAGTWGAAAPWAGTDPAAASAMRKSEERLRVLHPFAMTRYDRLRSEGADPLDAMREAAPMFGLHPHARPAYSRRPPGIEARAADAAPGPWTIDGGVRQPEPGPHQDAEHRGRRIAERLQAQAFYQRGEELSPEELASALEQATSLPAEVIARLARARNEESLAEGAERARASDLGRLPVARSTRERDDVLTAARQDGQDADTAGTHATADRRTAAQLAAESFPRTAADGIHAAVTGRLHQPAQSPARTTAVTNSGRVTSVLVR